MCGGVRHYNPRPRIAPTSIRYGQVKAEIDAWGSVSIKDVARGARISPADLAHYGEEGRKLAEWIRRKTEVYSAELPE